MPFLPIESYKRRKTTTLLVVHCSATKASADIGAKEIREWHIKERHFQDVGYHYIIRRNGKRECGRPTWAVGAHAEGHNHEAVGVCLVGGAPADDPSTLINETLTKGENNFTIWQFDTLRETLKGLLIEYPGATVLGHHDLEGVQKQCPSFDVKKWFSAD